LFWLFGFLSLLLLFRVGSAMFFSFLFVVFEGKIFLLLLFFFGHKKTLIGSVYHLEICQLWDKYKKKKKRKKKEKKNQKQKTKEKKEKKKKEG